MTTKQPRPSTSQHREQARAQAKALRAEQERRERRRTVTRRALLAGGGVAVAGGVVGVVLWDKSGASQGTGIPSAVAADGTLTFGKDRVPGSTNEGAKVLDVFFDYACSHCASFEVLHAEETGALLDAGTITLALHPTKILGADWTDLAMNAVGTVLENEPEKAFAFHNAVFSLYNTAALHNDGSSLTVAGLKKAAEGVGVSTRTTAKFDGAMTDNRFGGWTTAGTKTFSDKGHTGTPTVVWDGETVELGSINSETGLTDLVGGSATASGVSTTPADGGATEPADAGDGGATPTAGALDKAK